MTPFGKDRDQRLRGRAQAVATCGGDSAATILAGWFHSTQAPPSPLHANCCSQLPRRRPLHGCRPAPMVPAPAGPRAGHARLGARRLGLDWWSSTAPRAGPGRRSSSAGWRRCGARRSPSGGCEGLPDPLPGRRLPTPVL